MPQMRRTAPRQTVIPPFDRLANPRRGSKDSTSGGKAGKAGKDRPAARGASASAQNAQQVDAEPLTWVDRLRAGLMTARKPMTRAEAEEKREDLIHAYRTYANNADNFISHSNRHRQEAVIWSTLQQDELETLADFTLALARINPVVAQAVEGMIQAAQAAAVATMLGTRAWATLQFYAENGGFGIWLPNVTPQPRPQ